MTPEVKQQFDDLIALYKMADGFSDRAYLIRDAVTLLRNNGGVGLKYSRIRELAPGEIDPSYVDRLVLLTNLPLDAQELLWPVMDKKIFSLGVVMQWILAPARKRLVRGEGSTLAEAIAIEIKLALEKKANGVAVTDHKRKDPRPEKTRVDTASTIRWKQLAEETIKRIAGRIGDQKLTSRWERDLILLFDTWQTDLRAAKAAGGNLREDLPALATIASRKEIKAACEILHLGPPRKGDRVDLRLANKSRRKLLALYHPDTNGGDSSKMEDYHAVNTAYRLIEEYNEQVTETKTEKEEDHD